MKKLTSVEMEELGNYINKEVIKYLQNLCKYGHIYELRNTSWGDTPVYFIEKDKKYSIYMRRYSVSIANALHRSSNLEELKNLAFRDVKNHIHSLIQNRLESSDVQAELQAFKNSVKIAIEGFTLITEENHSGDYRANFKIGVKVL